MVNEKTVSFRIEPYIQEAMFQIILDVIILIVILTVLAFAGFPLIVYVSGGIVYVAITLVFHYRVAIQAIVDKWKGDYVTETVSIVKFIEEFSFAGDRLGHSNVRFIYPSEMKVCRYKIKVINNCGEKKNLRSVMSFRRLLKFAVLDKFHIEYLQLTYMKRSKILISVDLIEERDKNTSTKKKEDIERTTVKNAIHLINISI